MISLNSSETGAGSSKLETHSLRTGEKSRLQYFSKIEVLCSASQSQCNLTGFVPAEAHPMYRCYLLLFLFFFGH